MGQAQAQQQMQAQAQQQAEVERAKQQGAAEAMAAAPPAATAPAKDVTTELQKLADLHKSGVLTDEEFTAAKKKLLG
jgi:multidrug resistance efflux pump